MLVKSPQNHLRNPQLSPIAMGLVMIIYIVAPNRKPKIFANNRIAAAKLKKSVIVLAGEGIVYVAKMMLLGQRQGGVAARTVTVIMAATGV